MSKLDLEVLAWFSVFFEPCLSYSEKKYKERFLDCMGILASETFCVKVARVHSVGIHTVNVKEAIIEKMAEWSTGQCVPDGFWQVWMPV